MRPRAAPRRWACSERVRFDLPDYREVDRPVRPHRLGRHVRARRPRATTTTSSTPAAAAHRRRRDAAARDRPHRTAQRHQPLDRHVHLPRRLHARRCPRSLPAVERGGLIVTDIEMLRLHYAETLRAWRERFLARRERGRGGCSTSASAGCGSTTWPVRSAPSATRRSWSSSCRSPSGRRPRRLTRDYIAVAEDELRRREAELPPRLTPALSVAEARPRRAPARP